MARTHPLLREEEMESKAKFWLFLLYADSLWLVSTEQQLELMLGSLCLFIDVRIG